MWYLYRVALRNDSAKRLNTKAAPYFPSWETGVTALKACEPTHASKYELRYVSKTHTYTHASFSLVNGLPVLSVNYTEPDTIQTGDASTLPDPSPVSEREGGKLIDKFPRVPKKLLWDERGKTIPEVRPFGAPKKPKSVPVLDANGKPNSRAFRRRERKLAKGQMEPKPPVTLPKPPTLRPLLEPLQPAVATLGDQPFPFAPLRSRVSGEVSPVALDRPTQPKPPTNVPMSIRRRRWEQEERQLSAPDTKTLPSGETRALPLPSVRKGRQFKSQRQATVSVERTGRYPNPVASSECTVGTNPPERIFVPRHGNEDTSTHREIGKGGIEEGSARAYDSRGTERLIGRNQTRLTVAQAEARVRALGFTPLVVTRDSRNSRRAARGFADTELAGKVSHIVITAYEAEIAYEVHGV